MSHCAVYIQREGPVTHRTCLAPCILNKYLKFMLIYRFSPCLLEVESPITFPFWDKVVLGLTEIRCCLSSPLNSHLLALETPSYEGKWKCSMLQANIKKDQFYYHLTLLYRRAVSLIWVELFQIVCESTCVRDRIYVQDQLLDLCNCS